MALIDAAWTARAVGTWRGRPGLRAYRNLGIALEAFHVPSPDRPNPEEEAPDLIEL